jgi:hypothetical protein
MNHKNMEIGAVIVVIMIILLPFGWILLSHEPPGPFTKETSIENIKDAMIRAGVVLCSEKENTWDVPGALGGKTYTISTDCKAVDQSPDIIIHVQKFSSEETRDAAIRGFNSQTRGKPNGVILTHGPYVILLQGPLHGDVASKIKEQLSST